MATTINLDELTAAIQSGKINLKANGGNFDITGIPIDETGHVDFFAPQELIQNRIDGLQPKVESVNVPKRNYIDFFDGSALTMAKKGVQRKHIRESREKNEEIRQKSREEVASRSLSSQFEEYKAQEAAGKVVSDDIGGRYAYDKQAVADYRATDIRFGNSKLKNYVSNLDAKAELEAVKAKSEYDTVVEGLKGALSNNDEAAVKIRDEAKQKLGKTVSESAARTKEDLYRYLDSRTGFSSQREAWQKLISDTGWVGLTNGQKDNILQNNAELMSLQKKGYLGAEGLNLEKARSDSYEAFLGSDKGKSLMQEMKTVERLGDNRIYGTAGVAEKEVLSLLNRKAPAQTVQETLSESLKGAKFGGVGKMAIGALMTVGLVSALSDSRGSQTSAQLYGQAPLY